MDQTKHAGRCHCGALRWTFTTAKPLRALVPRACDCDFCTRHGAAWVSDPEGQLRILARDGMLHRYRQGSGQAEFLLCRECGVLVAVIAHGDGGWIGAANRNAFDARADFVEATSVSPRMLAPEVKLARWTQVWTPAELLTD
jgi:hypothetical protein